MTKEEILSALKMDEAGQVEWLDYNGVLLHKQYANKNCICKAPLQAHHESLADAAFRLRDELLKDFSLSQQHIIQVYRLVTDSVCYPDSPEEMLLFLEWLALDARPIHWIVAALLVKLDE